VNVHRLPIEPQAIRAGRHGGATVSDGARAALLRAGADAILAPVSDPSFDKDIKKLFRRKDRRSMAFQFDLWSYDDVSRWADAIAIRVRAGVMPCDGSWPADKVDTFQRWIDGGKQP
jgi:hypothetical protein